MDMPVFILLVGAMGNQSLSNPEDPPILRGPRLCAQLIHAARNWLLERLGYLFEQFGWGALRQQALRLSWVTLLGMALASCANGAAPAPTASLPPVPLPTFTAPPASAQPPAAASPAPIRPTLQASETPAQPPTSLPTPQATLRQLTRDGCCTQPFWSPDSQKVLYIDQLAPGTAAGIWGAALDGSAPQPITDRIGIYSADFKYRAFPERGQTIVERLSDGQRWTIPNGGRAVSFSPDGVHLAWSSGASGPPFDTALRTIWVSQVDGSQARQVHTAVGGGFFGWLSDGRLLINGRLSAPESGQALWALSLPANPGEPPVLNELARGQRLRNAAISPGGGWLAYLSTFSDDPALDGIWIVSTASGERRKLEQFGAYRWRDEGHLLLIPLDLNRPDHQLWQVEAATGLSRPLTDPASTPFKIANGDWSVSPNGQHVVFVYAQDNNLWLLNLPTE